VKEALRQKPDARVLILMDGSVTIPKVVL